jgi:large subunit ribosomal protein L18
MKQNKRAIRTRAKLKKNITRPRVTIFRSNKYILAQVIDDAKGKTIISVTEKELKEKGTKTVNAKKLGEIFAKKAIAKKIKLVVFDRGSYAYHGRVKAFADGAREGGLEF